MTARHVLTILAVADVPRAAAFYAAGLGWERTVDVPVYVELCAPGGMRLGLYGREGFGRNTGVLPAATPAGALAPTEVYLHVDDLDAAIPRLTAAGARPLSSRAPRDWGDEAAYFADPDGNVVVLARPLGGPAAGPAPAPMPAAGGTAALKAVATRWMVEVWQRRDLAALAALHAPDFVDCSPAGRAADLAAYTAGVADLFRAFPDFNAAIDALHAEENSGTVTVRWRATATHAGSFLGCAPTGRRVTFRGLEVLRIVAGRIVERFGAWDGLDLRAQLGGSGAW